MAYGIQGRERRNSPSPTGSMLSATPGRPVTLSELGPRHRVLFFYQHWCPGCHSHGFPALSLLLRRHRPPTSILQSNCSTTSGVMDCGARSAHEGRTVTGQRRWRTPAPAALWFVTIDAAGVVMEAGFAIGADQFIATAVKVSAAA